MLLAVDAVNDSITIDEDSVLDARATISLAKFDPNAPATGDADGGAPGGSTWLYLPPSLANLNQGGAGTFSPTDATWYASPLYSDTDTAHDYTGSGASPLGYARGRNTTDNVPFIDTDTVAAGTQKNITTYFRRHVTLNANQVTALQEPGATINVQMRADDGAVAYLNGHELIRKDVAANQTYTTLATPADAGNNGVLIVNASLTAATNPALFASLVVGDNVLAAEVHQNNNTSSDILFDLEVISRALVVAPILQNDTGVNLGATITVESLPTNGTLTDLNGTAITVVGQTLPGGEFVYTPNANVSGSDSFTYRVDNGGGDTDTANVDITVNAVNDPPAARNDYYTALEGETITAELPGIQAGAPVPSRSTWKYLDNGSNQDGAGTFTFDDPLWFASTTYSDAAWSTGTAEFGYGDGDEATVVGFGLDANNKFITTYFRRTFDVAPATATLYALIKVDDGIAIYINGVEAAGTRINLPFGALFNTPAGDPTAGATLPDDGQAYYLVEIDVVGSGIVLNGSGTGNIIAAEVHQNAANSSDVSFDLQLMTATHRMGVLENDADAVEGTAITAAVVNNAAFTALDAVGTLTFNPNGTFSFVPDSPGWSGTFTFNYTATDSGTPLPAAVSTGTVTLVLTPIDSGGVTLADDTYSFGNTGAFSGNNADPGGLFAGPGVLANDTIVAGDEFDPATVSLVGAAPDPATQGTLVLNADGTFTFTPIIGFTGSVSFQYQVNDGFNDYGPATVTLNVLRGYTVNEDNLLNVNIAATSPPTIIIPANSKWDFNDQIRLGENYPLDGVGRVWNDPAYDIATAGGFGAWVGRNFAGNNGGIYNQGTINAGGATPIAGGSADTATYLFRLNMNINNAAQVGALVLRGLIDDGAILYVNGKERFRLNMPAGPVTSDTYANATGNEDAYLTTIVDVSGDLVDGLNSVAVELHNQSGSSDAGFDLEVSAVRRSGLLAGITPVGPVTAITVQPGSSAAANGILSINSALDGRFTYQPNGNFHGTVTFTYTYTDDNGVSAPTTVSILVDPVPDVTVDSLTTLDTTPPLSGTVDDPTATVRVTVNGSTYVATNNGNGTWSLADDVIMPPLADGTYGVVVRATDANFDVGVDATASELRIGNRSSVVGRFVFYNQSAWDGNNAAIGVADNGAIAPDKTALLPGGTGSFANYTSYDKGINGIMIDLAGAHDAIGPADFAFKTGNVNNTTNWLPLTTAPEVNVRIGGGVGGSDRVTLTFPTNTIRKTWVQVRMLSNANTNLDAPDVFYFGNAVGEAGDTTANALVQATDEIQARANPRNILNPAPIDFKFDYNRDKLVNATDQILVRSNVTNVVTALRLIVPTPAAAPAAGALADAALAGLGDDEADILAAGKKRR